MWRNSSAPATVGFPISATSIPRASSNFDLRHRGVGSVVYEIPFFKRNRYFGGWEFSTLVSKQTGHYFAITVPNAR